MKKNIKWILIALLLLAIGASFGYQWWQKQQTALPDGLSVGNGRIEANETDIAVKYPGRVLQVLADEGDMVQQGQLLVLMDQTELQARIDRANADLEQGMEVIKEAEVQLSQNQNDLFFAQKQYKRVVELMARDLTSQAMTDEKEHARNSAQSRVRSAESRIRSLNKAHKAHLATLRQLDAELTETQISSPITGRVLYKLVQNGEVIGSGGKVLTVLDLSNIYMEIFLPAQDAGKLKIGSEARIILDAYSDVLLPAEITFVSPQAQFTPKQVETRSERDKLMFRVKLQIPEALMLNYIDYVKTGLRGTGYVRTDENIEWPEHLKNSLSIPENEH